MVAAAMLGAVAVQMSVAQDGPIADSCDAHLDDKVPQFRVASKFTNNRAQAVVIRVSIASVDVTQDKLIGLVCKLARDHVNERLLGVWILDDYRAAKRYNPQGEGNDEATDRSMRASYTFARSDNSQSLTWWPDPRYRSKAITVKLGAPPPLPGSHNPNTGT